MTDNLANLDSIEPAIVLDTLKARHASDKIYTKNGKVLIAINPYKRLTMYEQEQLDTYKSSLSLENEAPHIFATASRAHRAMIAEGRNQAVIISGESGAGKTESASFILQYLRFVSNASKDLEQRIYGASPLTEAFGCAKTVRNDNSSRFGKFLMLQFDQSAKIQGATLSTYLLEKSRVTHIGPGERSYHIFYCMVRGMAAAQRSALKLDSGDPSFYKYLSKGETGEPGGGRTDKMLFDEVETALIAQGLSEADAARMWQLLAGVLHLGCVTFDPSKPEAAAATKEADAALPRCEAVLGLQPGMLIKALCKRRLKVAKDFVEQELTVAAANDNRDALSKSVYSRLFDKLISQINTALLCGQAERKVDDMRIIGIVDIFGFEVFENNSLEQLCINFANEKLQALFTKTVFKETIDAYKADGIDAAEITFTDNADLLKLFEAPQTEGGVLAMLSEECQVPKGSDAGFCEKLHAAHPKSKLLTRVKGKAATQGFGIEHFAGAVTYSTEKWLDKNKDPLSGDLEDLMRFSDNDFLRELFPAPDMSAPAANRKFKSTAFKGVISTFRSQLSDLVSVLDLSDLHFVRCFKPNDRKTADLTEDTVINRQLHTSGVLDALRVARTGFPDRIPFTDFAPTFAKLYKGTKADYERILAKSAKEASLKLLASIEVPDSKYKVGRERLFFSTGTLDMIKTKRVEAMAAVAVQVQAGARGHLARGKARAERKKREAAKEAMAAAVAGEDIPALDAAIKAGKAAKVHFSPSGKAALAAAEQRLATLKAEAASRKAAAEALTKTLEGSNMQLIREAIAKAQQTRVDEKLITQAERRLKILEEEEQRRIEEEKRRREEEARLAALAAKEKAEAERKLAEERKRREAEEKRTQEEAARAEAKRLAEEDAADARRKAEAEAAERAKAAEEENALEEASRRNSMAEEEAAQRAIEEEEALREQVLEQLEADGVQYRSATADVLEYAVYLGMILPEDVPLLWIADEALQADDPEGWVQYESPNGDVYYVHEVTEQRSWQHPLDYQYQQMYIEEKRKRSGGETHLSSPPPKAAAAQPSSAAGAAVAPPKESPKPKEPQAEASDAAPSVPVSAASDEQLRGLLQRLLGTTHGDLRRLLTEPAFSKKMVRCFVVRHKSRMGGGRFDFFMSISKEDDMYCFTAKKHSVAKGCYYSISLDQDDQKRSKAGGSESFIGKVRSDRKSQEYTLYDDGANPEGKEKEKGPLRRELLFVNFVNSLRNRNPGSMQVVVPATDKATGDAKPIRPTTPDATLAERAKRRDMSELASLKNREPKWNPVSNMYQLDFHGRATLASCKNIQLHVEDGDPHDVSFLMGKVEENKFNVDFKGPFSCLQAFAFTLAVFDNSSGAF